MDKKTANILAVTLILVVVLSFLASMFFKVHTGRLSAISPDSIFQSSNRIGVVDIKGVIAEPQPVIHELDEFSRNNNIRAIIVRINSPGGGVAAAQEIYDTLVRIRKKKIVVVSMGTVAASGGYYIACGADKIVAEPGTITGSIGVIMEFFDVGDLLKWAKVKSEVVKSGKFKDIGSPFRAMKPDEKAYLQSVIDDVLLQFKTVVSENRHIPMNKVTAIADGRIFAGDQALKLGLVDKLGGLHTAKELTAKLSGIKGEPKLVYPSPPRQDFYSLLANSIANVVEERLFDNNLFKLSYILNMPK
ncbi:MAG: signal peptide peptidase SppA [Deltaproteobacteria bacterium]|nr:signal peptide peptidase SppA [Deltaproteobacteria bacterium]